MSKVKLTIADIENSKSIVLAEKEQKEVKGGEDFTVENQIIF